MAVLGPGRVRFRPFLPAGWPALAGPDEDAVEGDEEAGAAEEEEEEEAAAAAAAAVAAAVEAQGGPREGNFSLLHLHAGAGGVARRLAARFAGATVVAVEPSGPRFVRMVRAAAAAAAAAGAGGALGNLAPCHGVPREVVGKLFESPEFLRWAMETRRGDSDGDSDLRCRAVRVARVSGMGGRACGRAERLRAEGPGAVRRGFAAGWWGRGGVGAWGLMLTL